MSNELLNAANDDEENKTSEKRYEKLKKEQAGTDMDPAEERYEELKEEAKKEFIKKKRKEEKEDEEPDIEDKIEEEKEDGFVTY